MTQPQLNPDVAAADCRPMKITILGLSITSSWGNGHATTYRGLVRALAQRGHEVVFLERDVPWYAAQRDLPVPGYGRTFLYNSLADLNSRHQAEVAEADLVVVGSFVPEGIEVARWALSLAGGLIAFYDIDTPLTLARLARGECEYLEPELVPRFDLYLSFTGGPVLERLERQWGSPRARALYCSVDPTLYYPEPAERGFDLGYMGTYSDDRQPKLEALLLEPARRLGSRRFIVAGPMYPKSLVWPENVARIDHLPPEQHRAFYGSQRLTLNITRDDMAACGYAPSVRLFEAAACGVPIVSDWWEGLDAFFAPGKEILVARNTDDVVRLLTELGEEELLTLADAARRRILHEHTPRHRAQALEQYVREARRPGTATSAAGPSGVSAS